MYKKFNIETKTSNPFIKIAVLNLNSSYIDDNFFEIYDSLIEAQLHYKFDINEEIILTNNDFYEFRVLKTNLINLLSRYNSESKNYEKFYDKLINIGLDITKSEYIYTTNTKKEDIISIDYHSLKYVENKNIFTNVYMNDDLQQFLLKKFLVNSNINDFELYVKKFETLHSSVHLKKYGVIDFLLKNGVNINLLDQNGNTPLMKVNTLEGLKIFSQYNPDWFIKNINNEEALNIFIQIMDDVERKNILDFSYQLVNHLDPELAIKKRHTSLIELINNDKTKVEISDFIKKQNITHLNTIFDEMGNNLLMLSCMKGKLSKFDLFQSCDLNHFNNNNENILKILLELNTVNTKDIFKIFNAVLDTDNIIYPNLFTQIIENGFNNTNQAVIPKWLFDNSILHNKFYNKIGLNDQDKQKINDLIVKNKDWTFSNSDLFYSIYLLLNNKNEKIHYPNVSPLLKKIFNNEEVIKNNFYSFYSTNFDIFSSFVKATEMYEELDEYKNYILEKFSQSFSEHLNFIFKEDVIINEKKSSYALQLDNTISWLLENQVTSFIDNIDRKILKNYFNNNKKLSEMLIFYDLNNLIPQKIIKKGKKI